MPFDFLEISRWLPTFILIFFRVAGLMLAAPLFGSARIPRRFKVLMALVIAMAMARGGATGAHPSHLPDSLWQLTAGIAAEIIFGLVMGLSMSMAFYAVGWAGQIIGQQMGFNLAEALDPQIGSQASLVSDAYFMFLQVVFLVLGGHLAMLRGLHASLASLPLMSVGMNRSIFEMFLGLLNATTEMALQLAAPVMLTLLVVDLALGFVGRTMPQINVMSAGTSMKPIIGLAVLTAGLSMASETMRQSLAASVDSVLQAWRGLT